jgi:ABC-type sugar transport system ATPase subunit
VAGGKIDLPAHLTRLRNGPVTLGFRPEATSLASTGITARVDFVELLGAETHTICSLENGTRVVVRQGHRVARADLGEQVMIDVDTSQLHAFDVDSGDRLESSQ